MCPTSNPAARAARAVPTPTRIVLFGASRREIPLVELGLIVRMRPSKRLPCYVLLSLHSSLAFSVIGPQGNALTQFRRAPVTFGQREAASAMAVFLAAASLSLGAPSAWAGDGSLTEPQHLVAEAWKQVCARKLLEREWAPCARELRTGTHPPLPCCRQVDKRFVDRTFNGHDDWFKLRQDFVHRKWEAKSTSPIHPYVYII